MCAEKIIIINPRPFLGFLVNKLTVVKLKWGIEYKGILVSFDNYFNVRLNNTEEWVSGVKVGLLGEIVIRCNNILYIAKID
nr:small nuclear ribonucleoprotein E-like [Cryptomonas sp.]